MSKEFYDEDFEFLQDMGIPATRFIQIKGGNLEYNVLDIGLDALRKIYKMAEKNEIPYAENIKMSYYANCDIDFRGDNLIRFLKEFYPDRVADYEPFIESDEIYTLMCLDFS